MLYVFSACKEKNANYHQDNHPNLNAVLYVSDFAKDIKNYCFVSSKLTTYEVAYFQFCNFFYLP